VQLNLLDYQYPLRAGFREPTTSRDAADAIEASGRAKVLRDKCHEMLLRQGYTAKELALVMDVDLNSVRPRLSELKAASRIRESGQRREKQHVWEAL
jgi:hypothetical protein